MKKLLSKKIIISFLLVSIVIITIPQETHARNIFRQVYSDFKKGTKFVIDLPNKNTRWMGPTIGPIVAWILTENKSVYHEFDQFHNDAIKISKTAEDSEEQKLLMNEVRQLYGYQAGALKSYVKQLEEARDNLRTKLIEQEISMDAYVKNVIDLDDMITTVNESANRFENNAVNIKTQDVIKFATNNLIASIVNDVNNSAVDEISTDVLSLINPDIIKALVSTDSGSLDSLLDVLVSVGLEEYDKKINTDELRIEVKDRIKQALEENKDEIKENVKEEVKKIIDEMINNVDNNTVETKDQENSETDNENNLENAQEDESIESEDSLASSSDSEVEMGF